MKDSRDGDAVPRTLEQISQLYGDNLREHGLSSKSVGWRDEESQLLRFDRLVQVLSADERPFTVNDWGSGYGAMFNYMADRFGDRLTGYTGYDINPAMLAAAPGFTKNDPRARFVQVDTISEAADYAFVSGTFNVRFETNDEEWTRYIEQCLQMLAGTSRRGFAFNLLTKYVDWKDEKLYYADPFHFVDYCKRNISRYVALLHDYPLYEWTIYVRMP